MTNEQPVILRLKENKGRNRNCEPVTIGVPFPIGKYTDVSLITVQDQDGTPVCFGADILDRWPDGSIRWVLFDFLISMSAREEKVLSVSLSGGSNPENQFSVLKVRESNEEFVINTDSVEFHVDKRCFSPFNTVLIDGVKLTSPQGVRTELKDEDNELWIPDIHACSIEKQNDVKTVLFFQGGFSKQGKRNDLQFQSRLTFYSGCRFCSCEFTILNPKAAVHPDGFWDLGSPGSIYFKDLSVELAFEAQDPCNIEWKIEPSSNKISQKESLVIYQDSSGGENWQSKNHVNRHGEIPVTFRGYRVLSSNKTINEGLRASPVLSLSDSRRSVIAAIKDFWQNFPSAIGAAGNSLKISLFPEQFSDIFELQGGEQKTQKFFLGFSDQVMDSDSMDWVYDPIQIVPDAEWYAGSKAFYCLVPEKDIPKESPYGEILDLIQLGISGTNTFKARREIIDEYGWRNFGDLYADHENRLYLGEKPIISHYNNQYDLINSFIFQYISGGNPDWFILAEDLARHLIDIDIYHTDQDTYVYNHGLFWHTDHFASAHTATHRSFSKHIVEEDKKYTTEDGIAAAYKHHGSGPSIQHAYTHGLLNYYYLTGDRNARDGVIELADFIINCIQGPKDTKSILKKIARNTINWVKDRTNKDEIRPYGIAEGPDRGSGNSLSVLLDAYRINREKRYIKEAEKLIRVCIHPNDSIEERHLQEINTRWSYTIFLQALCKYLYIKTEMKELDFMFYYAKKTLENYAAWMTENETAILNFSDKFDFPNHATRIANDVRKSNILYMASKYAPEPLRSDFCKKADLFFKDSFKAFLNYEESYLTRPQAILMQNMYVSFAFNEKTDQTVEIDDKNSFKFGKPVKKDSFSYLVTGNLKLAFKIVFKGS